MAIEVLHNPMYTILNVLVLLVCLTAITFIAVVLLCGIREEELVEAHGRRSHP